MPQPPPIFTASAEIFLSAVFEMLLNDEVRQHGFTRDMLFSVDQIIAHVSKYMTLRIGDLIYTGTPVGVGKVQVGDNIKARRGGHTLLDFDVM